MAEDHELSSDDRNPKPSFSIVRVLVVAGVATAVVAAVGFFGWNPVEERALDDRLENIEAMDKWMRGEGPLPETGWELLYPDGVPPEATTWTGDEEADAEASATP